MFLDALHGCTTQIFHGAIQVGTKSMGTHESLSLQQGAVVLSIQSKHNQHRRSGISTEMKGRSPSTVLQLQMMINMLDEIRLDVLQSTRDHE